MLFIAQHFSLHAEKENTLKREWATKVRSDQIAEMTLRNGFVNILAYWSIDSPPAGNHCHSFSSHSQS